MRLMDSIRNLLAPTAPITTDHSDNPFIAIEPLTVLPQMPSSEFDFLKYPDLSESQIERAELFRKSSLELLAKKCPWPAVTQSERRILLNLFLDSAIESDQNVMIVTGPLDIFPPDYEAYDKILQLADNAKLKLLLVENREDSPWKLISKLKPNIPTVDISQWFETKLQYIALTNSDFYLCSVPRTFPENSLEQTYNHSRTIGFASRWDENNELEVFRNIFRQDAFNHQALNQS